MRPFDLQSLALAAQWSPTAELLVRRSQLLGVLVERAQQQCSCSRIVNASAVTIGLQLVPLRFVLTCERCGRSRSFVQ